MLSTTGSWTPTANSARPTRWRWSSVIALPASTRTGCKPPWRTCTWANRFCALYKHSILKNYVRGGNTEFGGVDRAEVGTNDVTDFRGLLKGVENLPAVRQRFRSEE